MTFKGDTFMEVASCLARTDPTHQPSFYTALEVVKRYSRSKIAKGKGRQFVGKGGKLEDLERKYAHLGYQDIFYLVRLHMGFPPSTISLPRPTSPTRKILSRAKYPLSNQNQDLDLDPDPFSSPQQLSSAAQFEHDGVIVISSSSRAMGRVNHSPSWSTSNIEVTSHPHLDSTNLLQRPTDSLPARRSSDLERLGLPETPVPPIPITGSKPKHMSNPNRPRTAPSPSQLPPPSIPLPATPSLPPPSRPDDVHVGGTRPLATPHRPRQVSNYFSSASSASSVASSPTSPLTPLNLQSNGDKTLVPEHWSTVGRTNSTHSNRSTYSPVSGRPQLNLSRSPRSVAAKAEADEEDELLNQLISEFNLAGNTSVNGSNAKRQEHQSTLNTDIRRDTAPQNQAQAQAQAHGRHLVISNPDPTRTRTPSRSGSEAREIGRQLHQSRKNKAHESSSSWTTGAKTPPPKYEERL